MKTLRLVWVVLVAGGFALWPGRAFASAVPDYKTSLEVLSDLRTQFQRGTAARWVAEAKKGAERNDAELLAFGMVVTHTWYGNLGSSALPGKGEPLMGADPGLANFNQFAAALRSLLRPKPTPFALAAQFWHVERFREPGLPEPPVLKSYYRDMVINGKPQKVLVQVTDRDVPLVKRLDELYARLSAVAPNDPLRLYIGASRSKDPKTRLGLIEQALSLGIERAFPEESLHLAMDASRALGQKEKSERYRMRLRAQLLANPKSVWTKLYQARHWDGLDAVMKRGG